MEKALVTKLHTSFEDMVRRHPETGTEFWCARDLQMLLGYAKWENFAKVVDRAITSCQTAGLDPKDHFLGLRKMVDLGSGAKREIDDIALTRYACYLIAQNGDPSTLCGLPSFASFACFAVTLLVFASAMSPPPPAVPSAVGVIPPRPGTRYSRYARSSDKPKSSYRPGFFPSSVSTRPACV